MHLTHLLTHSENRKVGEHRCIEGEHNLRGGATLCEGEVVEREEVVARRWWRGVMCETTAKEW